MQHIPGDKQFGVPTICKIFVFYQTTFCMEHVIDKLHLKKSHKTRHCVEFITNYVSYYNEMDAPLEMGLDSVVFFPVK